MVLWLHHMIFLVYFLVVILKVEVAEMLSIVVELIARNCKM